MPMKSSWRLQSVTGFNGNNSPARHRGDPVAQREMLIRFGRPRLRGAAEPQNAGPDRYSARQCRPRASVRGR